MHTGSRRRPANRGAVRWPCYWIAGLVLLGACAVPAPEPPPPESAPESVPVAVLGALEIHRPRVNLVPGTGAIYLEVVNNGTEADRLVRAETVSARVAETHETIAAGNVMRMVAHPEGFAVPAGGRVSLEPGGKHIMLIEPRLDEGQDSIAVDLHFERSGTVEVRVPVLALGASP